MFRLPGRTNRTVIIGRTGTGKSVFASWLLAKQPIDKMPWLIIDYKGEELFRGINARAVTELKPGAKIPRHPGLYITYPLIEEDDRAVEDMLWNIYDRGRTGLFVDEAPMLPNCTAMTALMAQGRSKRIPAIVCTQRPVGIDPYIFSQASYFAVFPIQRRKDQLYMEEYINTPKFLIENHLERHHCLWRDVDNAQNTVLSPVPPPSTIVDRLNLKAPHRFWW